ncbi:class I SAM-dependent methyltransferase [Mangrovihabitans endophyticus]|uniref:Methyltransferase type 11 domain-containing protein n=1 Tax=Mangrovihabitans endophyticus TaxID=1751298 RepID=A0A8J3BUY7_9ACTN|nr:class I SAM-dependent methyltransferase [Mangrovihabitans endophyticus]GGK76755.1 hypothetical protein GCM10012284_08370 [Mangrovihabitans endophyticus]
MALPVAAVTGGIDVLGEQRAGWDAATRGWSHWFDAFERGGRRITAMMLDRGRVRSGQRVLDVGTGLGEPALSAARVVGSAGSVVGVDLSGTMLAAARARAAGTRNVDFRHRAVEDLDLAPASCDVVLSRWCLMFLADRGAALRRLRRLLRPGGALVATVWGPPETAPVVGLVSRVVHAHLGLGATPPGHPGTYGLSDPRRCVAELVAAGFVDVSVVVHHAPFWWHSSAEFANFAWDVMPPSTRQMLADWCDPGLRTRIRRGLVRASGRHRQPGGRIVLPSAVLCLRATRPGPRLSGFHRT